MLKNEKFTMAIARIVMIFCVRHSSGVDAGVTQAFANLTNTFISSEFPGSNLISMIPQLAEVITAIDTARDDPDQLFMTTSSSDVDNAFWPGAGQTDDVFAGQSRSILLDFEFTSSLNISLWDRDPVSANDHMGSITILENEAGQGEIAKLASNPVEGSAYYVFYEVFA